MDDKGPDVIIETNERVTSTPDGAVSICYENEGFLDKPSLSIPTVFKRTVLKYPERVALAEKQSKLWKYIKFKEYHELVCCCAKAFIKLGLPRFRTVCIMGFNSSEWIISDLAAIHAGGFACGIYATNTTEATKKCMEMALCSIAVLEDEEQVAKVLAIKDLPDLLKIIQYKGTPKEEGVLSWNELLDIGRAEPDTELQDRLRKMSINQCARITFTSGTTGESKAVMLSHDNILSCTFSVGGYMKIVDHETVISFLPLSHVAAAGVDIYLTMAYGGTTYIASKKIMKGAMVQNLREVKPTRFTAVPRVYEKIYEKFIEAEHHQSTLQKKILNYATSTMLKEQMNKINGLPPSSSGLRIRLSKMILGKLKKRLGFGKCKSWINAAAPLSTDIQKYFLGLGIPISSAYGLTETTGAHTLNLDFKIGSVGKPCHDMRVKLAQVEDMGDGEGEILLKGRDIFMGYLNAIEETKQVFDEDGWFKTGDLGTIDSEGFIYISGRIKELIITAGGENVAPIPIEDRLKRHLPIVNNAVVIGEREKFLSVLLTLKRKMDTNFQPLDELSDEVKEWCKSIGSSSRTIQDILAPDTMVEKAIFEVIEIVNQYAISRAQLVHKFKILPTDFSIQNGELGDFQAYHEVKKEFYNQEISSIY